MMRRIRRRATFTTANAAIILTLILLLFTISAGARQGPEEEHAEGDHPAARAAWFAEGRQAPSGAHARAWYFLRGWRRAQQMPRLIPGHAGGHAHAATLPGNWAELGPKPESAGNYGAVAGRITAIAVDTGKDPSGNTVYLGAAYGGLWKSTNALSANPVFTPIGDSMPTLAVGAIALDSSTSPTTIYIGTGEPNESADSYYGVGILKSTDGGQSWSTVSEDTAGHDFFGLTWSRILVDPSNPKIVMAAATFSGAYDDQGGASKTYGVFVSTDGGATFTPKKVDAACTDLAYDSQTHTYYAVFTGLGVWTSSDQGNTWKPAASPFASGAQTTASNFSRASLAARNGVVAVLVSGGDNKPSTPVPCPAQPTSNTKCDTGLSQSSDGGKTWTPVAIPGTLPQTTQGMLFCSSKTWCQGLYDQYVGMPPGGNDLVIGGIDAWRLSSGSGLSAVWTNLTDSYSSGPVHPDEHAFAANADGSVWFIGNDGGIWSSRDKGADWANLNASLGVIQFISVSADLGQPGVYFGGSQDNGTAVSDSGSNLLWKLVWGGDGGYTFDNPMQPNQYFTESIFISMVRSDDGGKSFVPVVGPSTIPDLSSFYTPYTFSGDFTRMYVGTASRVWSGPAVPTSPGSGWQPISDDLIGGSCTGPHGGISAIAVAPSDPDYIYAGFGTGWLSVTKNATAAVPNWSGSQVGLCSPISSIAVDPVHPEYAYVTKQGFAGSPGTSHVFATNDGGLHWWDISQGLPDVPFNSVALDPKQPQNLFVGTDAGVFATSDAADALAMTTAGVTWEQLGSGLPAVAVLQLKVVPGDTSPMLLAATHGRGAWTIPAVAPPNFALSTDQSSYLAPRSASQFQFVPHIRMINGSTAPVQLQCSSPDTGTTCALSPSTVSANGDVTVTVQMQPNWSTHSISLTGQDGAHKHSLSVTLVGADYSLESQTSAPLSLEYGSSLDIPIALQSDQGWATTITLDCPGLPAGIHCSASPGSFASLPSGTTPATLTLSADPSATATNPLPVTVAATSEQQTRTVTIPVNTAHFSLTLPANEVEVGIGTSSFTTTATAQSASNSNEPITLGCQSLDQAPLQCSFSPATIQPGQSSTLTATGFPTRGSFAQGFRLAVTGTSGNEMAVSEPLQVKVQGIDLSAENDILPSGADSYTGTFTYTSEGSYTTPVNLSCSADNGAQCAMASASVSGSGTGKFTLTHFSNLAPGRTVQVTLQATNSDLSRQATASLSVVDFEILKSGGYFTVKPGYWMDSRILTTQTIPPEAFTEISVACSAEAPLACSTTAIPPNQTTVQVDARNFAANGGKFPTSVQVTEMVTDGKGSASRSLTIPVHIADFQLQPPQDPVTVTAGSSANFTVKVIQIDGLRGSVSLQCTGAPAGATCRPGADSITVPGPASFQVTTTAPGAAMAGVGELGKSGPASRDGEFTLNFAGLACGTVGLLLLAGTILAGARGRRRILLLGAGLVLLLLIMPSCGGGPGGSHTAVPGSGGGPTGGDTSTPTPKGTSTLTITATYSDPDAPWKPSAVVHTTTVPLQVQ